MTKYQRPTPPPPHKPGLVERIKNLFQRLREWIDSLGGGGGPRGGGGNSGGGGGGRPPLGGSQKDKNPKKPESKKDEEKKMGEGHKEGLSGANQPNQRSSNIRMAVSGKTLPGGRFSAGVELLL